MIDAINNRVVFGKTRTYPATAIQKEMWIHWKMFPKSTAYHTVFTAEICSSVHTFAIKKFFDILLQRHEILRSNFQLNGSDLNIISHDAESYYYQHMVENNSINNIKKRIRRFLHDEINLEISPLFQVALFTQSKETHFLAIKAHHSVIDAWSVSLMLKEFDQIYPSLANLMPIVTTNVRQSFQSFSQWQKEFIHSEEGKKQRDFWKSKITKNIPYMAFSIEKHKNKECVEGKTINFHFNKHEYKTISTFAKNHAISVHVIFLTAFHILLNKYSSCSHTHIGVPTSNRLRSFRNRRRTDYKNTIGCFADLVLTSASFEKNIPLIELMKLIQTDTKKRYRHQDYPLSILLKTLNINKHTVSVPQVLFAHQKKRQGIEDISMFMFKIPKNTTKKIGGLTFKPCYFPQQAGQFELALELLESETSVYCNLKYLNNTADALFFQEFIKNYKDIIDQMIHRPYKKIGEVCLLTSLCLKGKSDASIKKYLSVMCLFKEQVKKYPSNVAVQHQRQQISYKALDSASTLLAHHLISENSSKSMIAINVRRSITQIIAILAILKSGSAFIYIDPKLSENRKNSIKNISGARLVLSDSYIDQCLSQQIDTATELPPIHPSDTCYGIFTSGSTGEPKCVQIHHAALLNHMIWMNREWSFDSMLNILQRTSLSFDASIWEVFAPLLSGGKCTLLRPDGELNPRIILEDIKEHEVNIIQLVPSLLKAFLTQKKLKEALSSIRYFMIGGEYLESSTVTALKKVLKPSVEMVNLYGPSEATIDASFYKFPKTANKRQAIVPIGTPVSNSRIYIVDKYNTPLPKQVCGQIAISGVNVFKGYKYEKKDTVTIFETLNTSERPIIYKTGDFGYIDKKHQLIFIGRQDQQVKYKGYRIELRYIENALNSYPNIQESIVFLSSNFSPTASLIGGYTTKKNISIHDLGAYLERMLPTYMIPTPLIELDAVPLLNTGKVDRKKAEAIIESQCRLRTESSTEKLSKTQKKIQNILSRVLGGKLLGLNDHFFEHGGDSLKSVIALNHIEASFDKTIDITTFLATPTILHLDNCIKSNRTSKIRKYTNTEEGQYTSSVQPLRSSKDEYKRILLTGSTGFLGTFIVFELLTTTTASIYCLVRELHGQKVNGLKHRLMSLGCTMGSIQSRLIFIEGDLTKHNLGIERHGYESLRDDIDCVIHNAAAVNYVDAYDHLKSTNVDGTTRMISFSDTAPKKDMVYISTLSVFGIRTEAISETATLDPAYVFLGYSKSKMQAEIEVRKAIRNHSPITILRPGFISGSCDGRFINPDDIISRFLTGISNLRMVPDVSLSIRMIPVDFLAKVIVGIVNSPKDRYKPYNIYNPMPTTYEDILGALEKSGHKLQRVSLKHWVNELSKPQNQANPLFPLVPFINQKVMHSNKRLIEVFDSNEFEQDNFMAWLSHRQLKCPVIRGWMLERYVGNVANVSTRLHPKTKQFTLAA